MQTEKEQIQNQIQVLQEKLKKLEAQEPEMLLLRQGKVDFVDYKKKTYLRIEYEYSEFFPTVYEWYELEKFHLNLMPIKHLDLIDPLEELYQKQIVPEEPEPSMTNCVITGNPPDGYVTWQEWYNELGSKGILHNLRISSIEQKKVQKEQEVREWDVVRRV